MTAFFKSLFKLLEGLALFALAFIFLRWFVKNLTGKYWYLFWLWLVVAVLMVVGRQQKVEDEYGHRTGAEIWEANH